MNNSELKMLKMIFISVICGVAAFFLCAYLHTLPGYSGRSSDPIGSGLAELFALVMYAFIGLVTFGIALGLQIKGARVPVIIGFTLIPVVLNASGVLLNYVNQKRGLEAYRRLAGVTVYNDHCPSLFNAVRNASPEEVSRLIRQGISPDIECDGKTPLFRVKTPHRAKKAQILIDAGADVNFQSSDKEYPFPIFFYAVDIAGNMDDSEYFKTFVIFRYGSKKDRIDTEDAEVLQALINAGADIEVRNSDGNTPLLEAARFKSANTMMVLIENGANINATNDKDDTPLLLAAYRTYGSSKKKRRERDIELLKHMVERGADKSVIGSERRTAYKFLKGRDFEEHEIEFLKP